MERITLLAFISAICFLSVEAQNTPRLKEGSLNFLKEVKNLHVVFDYSDIIMNGRTEEYYAATREEKWKNNWDNDKIQFYKFFTNNANVELISKNASLRLGDFPDAEYLATVKVLKMIDASHIYTAEVIFTKMDFTDVLAVVSIDYRKGSISKEWTLTQTINKIMKIAGKQFGKLIVKNTKP